MWSCKQTETDFFLVFFSLLLSSFARPSRLCAEEFLDAFQYAQRLLRLNTTKKSPGKPLPLSLVHSNCNKSIIVSWIFPTKGAHFKSAWGSTFKRRKKKNKNTSTSRTGCSGKLYCVDIPTTDTTNSRLECEGRVAWSSILRHFCFRGCCLKDDRVFRML